MERDDFTGEYHRRVYRQHGEAYERGDRLRQVSRDLCITRLGWAATPAGLKAMESLQTLNPKKDTASRSIRMFMIVNMSSLQIVSINIIAYRMQYNSVNPSEIIGPGLLATLVSTAAGIVFCKLLERCERK